MAKGGIMTTDPHILEPCPECKSENSELIADAAGYQCRCLDCGFSTIRCVSALLAITLWNDFSLVNNQWLEGDES